MQQQCLKCLFLRTGIIGEYSFLQNVPLYFLDYFCSEYTLFDSGKKKTSSLQNHWELCISTILHLIIWRITRTEFLPFWHYVIIFLLPDMCQITHFTSHTLSLLIQTYRKLLSSLDGILCSNFKGCWWWTWRWIFYNRKL